MNYRFNTWYFDKAISSFIYVIDIKSKLDREGFWGWRFDTELLNKKWEDDNSNPEIWEYSSSTKEETPNLNVQNKIEMLKDLFSL